MNLRAHCLLFLFPTVLLAQPSATMRRALLETVDVEVSSSSREPLARGGAAQGTVTVLSTSLSVSGRRPLDATTALVYGLAYQRHDLDATSPLLPDQLAELTLNLGLIRRFSAAWSGAVFARPGIYGDFEDLSARSLNLPVLAMLTYTRSETLSWNFGLNLDVFSDHPLLPIAGVRWQFAPEWTFSVGFPQSGFSWRASDTLTLRAGVGFTGGSYRITSDRGVAAVRVDRLTDTFLNFREVRAGVGADIKLGGVTLAADLGLVTDRKFDYFDRGVRLDGDTGFYGTLALKASF
jgi:hypothetical protein